jgi:4-amino-4-deoxy-L-arabinose transferase-like glycosyltransferase
MECKTRLMPSSVKGVAFLLLASAFMLFLFLDAREVWTQEHRWTDIVSGMFYRHDFLHPYLEMTPYYDKPLLSYWCIVFLSYLSGGVSLVAARLPSALAGLVSVWCLYGLGKRLYNKPIGLLSAWMLITTYYFVFWARTSSADLLNVAGTLLAVYWYFTKKSEKTFWNYTVFFIILAITSLCKGLIGAVVPLIVIFPDLLYKMEWKNNLKFTLILSLLPAAFIYVLPFMLSAHTSTDYTENGLYLVYRENILRYFQAYDHKGPIYTYFVYLPIYLFPWCLFFIPALFAIPKQWRALTTEQKSMCWAFLLLFVFLTLSGSRRNYYVLPLVPFALLITAQWIMQTSKFVINSAIAVVCISYIFLFADLNIVQPWYYSNGGIKVFAKEFLSIQQKNRQTPKEIVMLDPESKIRFYLKLSPMVDNFSTIGDRDTQSDALFMEAWPLQKIKQSQAIIISRKQYLPFLTRYFSEYHVLVQKPTRGEKFLHADNINASVALFPPGSQL